MTLAMSPDGHSVVTGSWSDIQVWDAKSGVELAVLAECSSQVRCVTFSQDCRRIASGFEDGTLRVWDASSRAEIACLRGHSGVIWRAVFAPDSGVLATLSEDKTIRIWDIATGTELACIPDDAAEITDLAFAPDGRRVFLQSREQRVRVLDIMSGRCVRVIEGGGDVAAIARGAEAFPWRALCTVHETVIESSAGSEPVAWFPVPLGHIATHPSGRVWAGSVGNHLYLISLEGTPRPAR
jgi:WD40 repeat protein